jgi:hypothetical protein
MHLCLLFIDMSVTTWLYNLRLKVADEKLSIVSYIKEIEAGISEA